MGIYEAVTQEIPLSFSAEMAFERAENKARIMRVNTLNAEHLLWALLHDTPARNALSESGIRDLGAVELVIERNQVRGSIKVPDDFKFNISRRIRKILDFSLADAVYSNSQKINTIHLLKGIATEGGSRSAIILSAFLMEEGMNRLFNYPS